MAQLTKPGLLGVAVDLMASRTARAIEITQLAEHYRADFVSVPDHPYVAGELDTWTMLATLAARTQHVGVVSNVTSLPLRPPVMLAKTAVSLQVLSAGRVALGIGAGVAPTASFGAPPWNPGAAVSALDEAVRLVRELVAPTDGPASYDGTIYQAPEAPFGPIPATPVPIWIGAFGPRMLALTGRYSDAWLPTNYYLDLADVPAMQRRIDAAAENTGRDPWDVLRIFNVMGTISGTASTENGRRLVGPASFWVDALSDYHERLGFDSFTFWPVAGHRATQVAQFFEEVRPQLPDIFRPGTRTDAD